MWVRKRKQVDGFRLVLAVDRQVEDMLRQFWIVLRRLDLFFVRKGSLKLLVFGLGASRPFDAVVYEPVTIAGHRDRLHSSKNGSSDSPQPMLGAMNVRYCAAM